MAYNFGSSYTTQDWNTETTSNQSGVGSVLFDNSSSEALIPEFGFGTDGSNSFTLHINTTADDNSGTFTRNTAWRKAYRILNRFDVGDINMDRRRSGDESQATYVAKRSFADKKINGFELPFDHKPPCRFPNSDTTNVNGGSRPYIELVYSMRPKAVEDPSGEWDGNVDDDLDTVWSIGSTGLKLIENSTPDSIEFTVLKTGNAPNQRIDTSTAIIPAYSGEILSYQDGEGVGYIGNESGETKIYIDITQTDEILRWDSDNNPDFDPHEWWLKTFSSIQVRNDTRNLSRINLKKSTMEVVSKDKNNYVISFTSSSPIPISSWRTGDIIRVQFKRKKTILIGDIREPWAGAEYQSIRYRSLEDEFLDDPWVQPEPPVQEDPLGACCVSPGNCQQLTQQQCIDTTGSGDNWAGPNTTVCNDCEEDPDDGGGGGGQVSSEILPFTIRLDGKLDDGSIIVNYPDGFEATGIKFEAYIEKDPPSAS